jgi:hypothetical protein
MLQWIAGLEKVAATSPFAASNRFGSFAPVRQNVAAQWLVDGVRFISWAVNDCWRLILVTEGLFLEPITRNSTCERYNLHS